MVVQLLVAGLLLQASPNPQAVRSTTIQGAPLVAKDEATDDPKALLKLKRIYVESFGEDIISKELQSMIVSSLVSSKRFKVTENRERADAILKGVALEKTSQELHAYGESTAVGAASGGAHGEIGGSVVNGNGTISGSSSGGFIARHMGTSDSSVNTETINEGKRLSNTPVRQAGSVLKCPDDRKNRAISAQATYPCGSSAVGGRVCEQRYAAERVLPESGFEFRHAESSSEETALEEKA